MRSIAILLICLSATACRTVAPQQKQEIERRVNSIRIPELDLRSASVADVIAFLIEQPMDYDPAIHGPSRPFSQILRPSDPTPEEAAHRRRYAKRYARLKEHCGDKTISLHLCDCSLLNLLEFVTRHAGVDYEFKGNRVIIKTPEGAVLAGD